MSYAVYSDPKGESLLLVNENLWVINGDWQIEKRDGKFYCVAPHGTFEIDIHLAGYIDYDGDYNSTLNRFRDGEGTRILQGVSEPEPVVEVVHEFCKKKYYGIDCFCSKCKR